MVFQFCIVVSPHITLKGLRNHARLRFTEYRIGIEGTRRSPATIAACGIEREAPPVHKSPGTLLCDAFTPRAEPGRLVISCFSVMCGGGIPSMVVISLPRPEKSCWSHSIAYLVH